MGYRSFCGAIAVLAMVGFAPQPDPQRTPNCGGSPQAASKEFVDGYAKARAALGNDRLADAIAAANAVEPLAANDRQRSALSSVRQTAYAGLKDDKGVLAETERQLDLGCLAPEQVLIQTEMASDIRKNLGLPPRN